MNYMYKIPKDINENRICLLGKIKLSGKIMCFMNLLISVLLITAHMSNVVPSFFEVIGEVWFLLPFALILLIPMYLVYWVGVVIFPIGFIITVYNIITEYRLYKLYRKNRKSYFIKKR